jgi:alkylation response protein AidB-like acyl-CoA dehydrogenase
MKSPGVTARPIVMLDGEHDQRSLVRGRVPVANRVGEENKGWTYAKYLLGHERTGNITSVAARWLRQLALAAAQRGAIGD